MRRTYWTFQTPELLAFEMPRRVGVPIRGGQTVWVGDL
jgi:hypothetical protein